MGVFSKYHRFREAGEEANINNVQRFGEPAVSLFTTTKVFTLHGKKLFMKPIRNFRPSTTKPISQTLREGLLPILSASS